MRKLGDIFALMIFIPGMIFVAAGCMGGGSFSFWLGVAMMLGGVRVSGHQHSIIRWIDGMKASTPNV